MIRIAPFRALCYSQKKIKDLSKVIAPPYDVISKDEQDKLYKKSAYNFVRLDLSQDPDSYNAVAQLLGEWQNQGVLERDETPAIYFSSHGFKLKSDEQKVRAGLFRPDRTARFFHRRHQAPRKNPRRAERRPAEAHARLPRAVEPDLRALRRTEANVSIECSRVAVEGMAPFVEIELDNGDECKLWRITDPAVHRKSAARK